MIAAVVSQTAFLFIRATGVRFSPLPSYKVRQYYIVHTRTHLNTHANTHIHLPTHTCISHLSKVLVCYVFSLSVCGSVFTCCVHVRMRAPLAIFNPRSQDECEYLL